ncbi:hypothetical protein D7X25_15910 [bacterium 1XD42-8]|jgi:hypothetical protein|nr:hypothetical protein [Lachnospiraceae bacterium]RKJ52204.1 hypothetical protein D7X25_15910 [bacterium 1XD42-8]
MNGNMKKYVKMQLKDKDFHRDFVNMCLGIVIIVLGIIQFMMDLETTIYYGLIFLLGTVMTTANVVKFHKDNKVLSTMFLFLTIILMAAAVLSAMLAM